MGQSQSQTSPPQISPEPIIIERPKPIDPTSRIPNVAFADIYKARRFGNGGIALALMTFVGLTFAYTIRSVSQEDFSDVDERGFQRDTKPNNS